MGSGHALSFDRQDVTGYGERATGCGDTDPPESPRIRVGLEREMCGYEPAYPAVRSGSGAGRCARLPVHVACLGADLVVLTILVNVMLR